MRSDDIIDRIKSRADIVDVIGEYVELHQRGRDFWGCCPFHHEKTPSFKVNQERGLFYCFGCKKSGNIFHFVQEMENTDFPGALRWLADKYGIEMPEREWHGRDGADSAQAQERRRFREQGLQLLAAAADFYHDYLLKAPEAEAARVYLTERGRSQEAINQFKIGFSPDSWDAIVTWAAKGGFNQELLIATGMAIQRDNSRDNSCYDRFRNRLMFPIFDEFGKVIGFSGRTLEQNPKSQKYVNSPDSDFFHKGKTLYAFNFARQHLREIGYALICEGQMDVISCHQAGLVQAVAAQGTAFTEEHAALLKRSASKARLAFDGDTAGLKATMRTIRLLQEAGMSVGVVSLPKGEDPDSIFRVGGREALEQIIGNFEDAVPFAFRNACQTNDISSPEGKSAIVSDVIDVISTIKDPIARTAHCQWLAGQLHLPENILQDTLASKISSNIAARQREEDYKQREAMSSASQSTTPAAPPRNDTPQSGNITIFSPVMLAADNTAKVLETMLDLIVHHEFLANQLASVPIHEILPNIPLGQAIAFIMAYQEQGDWNGGVQALSMSDLIHDPGVAAAFVDSKCETLTLPQGASQDAREKLTEKLGRQLQDCLTRLHINRLQASIADTQRSIEQTAPEEILQLLQKKSQMQRQLEELKRSLQ